MDKNEVRDIVDDNFQPFGVVSAILVGSRVCSSVFSILIVLFLVNMMIAIPVYAVQETTSHLSNQKLKLNSPGISTSSENMATLRAFAPRPYVINSVANRFASSATSKAASYVKSNGDNSDATRYDNNTDRPNLIITNIEINTKADKLSLYAKLDMQNIPGSNDYIMVLLNGISLVNTSFNNFSSVEDGVYQYTRQGVEARLDFNRHQAKFSRPNINIDMLSVSGGVDALMQFGDTQLSDHFSGAVIYK